MNEQHYHDRLTAFLHHELPADEKQAVGAHLLRCAECRRAHDRLKKAAALAAALPRADAPERLWLAIEADLHGGPKAAGRASLRRTALAAAALGSLLILLALAFAFSFLIEPTPELATAPPAAEASDTARAAAEKAPEISPAAPAMNEKPDAAPPQRAQDDDAENNNDRKNGPAAIRAQNATPAKAKRIAPKASRPAAKISPPPPQSEAGWHVETIAGAPAVGALTLGRSGRLATGETLETDAASRARIEVADIGEVELAPNSRVQLVRTTAEEHRLSLEKGELHARIFAPPRLFIVDTPSAAAVDLGCEYTLEVDAEGNARLHVTSGFVALERDGRDVIVPAGAIALTKKGAGLGTPFAENASEAWRRALYEFDFAGGGAETLRRIVAPSTPRDAISLWHLLEKTSGPERETVFEKLAEHVAPPAGVTRAGVLRLDRRMLDEWWTQIENAWFEQ